MYRIPSFVAAVLLASTAHAAVPKPMLTAEAIDVASFEEWDGVRRSVQERKVEADRAALDAVAAGTEAPPQFDTKDLPDADLGAIANPDPFLIRVQILLDRAHASPGVVDGYLGDNLSKAVKAFEAMRGLPVDGRIDPEFWKALSADAAPVLKTYEVTKDDAKEKYAKSIPEDYAEKAKMKRLSYTSPAEMMAERFHMDQDLIEAMNKDASFRKRGEKILVADTGAAPTTETTRIVVDKSDGELVAYDGAGAVIAAYPATIGSKDTPSPEGEVKVVKALPDPGYTYNPNINFKQGDNDEILEIPRGPNGPVGSMWIDLDKPTYGIHGTPEPSRIDKSNSHGCVRLTNWDAGELAAIIQPDRTIVVFQD
jgi:lipoprotein-anchoring transpeptidase ErfK/SrfK